ncbi:hypothetical protein J437_LFUL018303, partial [Ladona fulva]
MSEPGEFVSVFRKHGRPILPPVLTPMRRAEMQEYKLKALAIEKKLLEKKMSKENSKVKSDLSQNETFTEQREGSGNDTFSTGDKSSDCERYNKEEEDKENEDFNSGRKSVDTLMPATKTFKYPFSERPFFHSNNSDSELHSVTPKESAILVDQAEDEACSVVPTDSTDLQQYLDSTLGDVSPEVGSNFDHSENVHFVGNEEEDLFRVSALLALENKLAAMRFSPLVDLSKEIPRLILQGKSDSFCYTAGEKSSENADLVLVKTPAFQDDKIECIAVPCLPITSILDAEAKEVEPPSVPDSNVGHISLATVCNSEIETVPSNFEENPPHSTPLLVRRGSYTLDSPSPTLLANIHKYSVDDLPKSGIHSEGGLDVGKGKKVQENENSASENAIHNVKTLKKTSKSRSESGAMSGTSKPATNGRSVFERLAADAARKVEARRKSAKEGTFKVPDIKKVPKSIKGLRSAISINNIRASLTEAHKKRSSLSAARRCNSDVNIPYTVVKAVSSKSHPVASTQSQKKQKSVDINEAPPHPLKSLVQNGTQVDTVAAQKRKRRRWSERWEGWTKVIEPIHRNLSANQVSNEGDKVSAERSESFNETPKFSTDKSASTQNDQFTNIKVVEKVIDSYQIISGGEHASENNVMLVNGKDLGCHAENIPVKEKKESDNLLIAKQSLHAMHSSTAIPEIQGSGISASGDVERESPNDSHTHTTELNVAPRICEERMLRNECQVPEIPQEVASNSNEPLESNSAITESACAADTSFELSLQGSPKRNPINVDETSSTQKIPLDLQRTIESLPGTPIGQHSAKDMALNILSRVIEEQDKALQNLLAENRKKEENIREKFQEQLKYLVGKLTRLVQAMPSPSIKEGSVVQTLSQKCHSEDNCISINEDVCLSSPSSIGKVSKLQSQPNVEREKSSKAVSTPNPGEKEKSKYNPLTSPIPELVNSLSLSNYVDAISMIGVEDKTSSTNESHDDTLKRTPVMEDITNVSCTPGLKSLTPKSCSSCSGNTSVHSSTLKDDLKPIQVFLNAEKSDTAEYISLREKDATSTAQDSEQKMSQKMSNKEFYDSNSEVTLHDLKSSTAIEGCKTQNDDLDLSGILEMELQGKNISHLPGQSVCSNPLLETCSSSLSSVVDSKEQMNYGFLIDELALHRKKYEDDVLRLDIAESTPRSKVFIDSITLFRNDNEEGECQILTKKSPTEHMKKLGIQTSIISELPDLKSDVMALQTYLGSEMPSTGPITLETPISTAACILEGAQDYQIADRNQPAARVNLNMRQDQWHLRKSKSLKSEFLSPKLNEENKEADLVCDPEALIPPIRSSTGRTAESLTDAKYLTPESSSSSVNYVSAMSGSLACSSVVDDSEKKKDSKVGALVRGYLTRRLLKTTRVLGIKATIQDSIETALKLHSEVSEEKDVAAADVLLHGRILAQLSAAYNELHHIFFELPVKERMAIINNDRQRLLSRNSTPVMYDPIVAPSPRPALLSAVTLKTLQRRFGDEIPTKK